MKKEICPFCSFDHQSQSYFVTICVYPRNGIKENSIMDDIGEILNKNGYWCYGLIGITREDSSEGVREGFKRHYEELNSSKKNKR